MFLWQKKSDKISSTALHHVTLNIILPLNTPKELKPIRITYSISVNKSLQKAFQGSWDSQVLDSNKQLTLEGLRTQSYVLLFCILGWQEQDKQASAQSPQGPTRTKRLCDWQENTKKGGDPLLPSSREDWLKF